MAVVTVMAAVAAVAAMTTEQTEATSVTMATAVAAAMAVASTAAVTAAAIRDATAAVPGHSLRFATHEGDRHQAEEQSGSDSIETLHNKPPKVKKPTMIEERTAAFPQPSPNPNNDPGRLPDRTAYLRSIKRRSRPFTLLRHPKLRHCRLAKAVKTGSLEERLTPAFPMSSKEISGEWWGAFSSRHKRAIPPLATPCEVACRPQEPNRRARKAAKRPRASGERLMCGLRLAVRLMKNALESVGTGAISAGRAGWDAAQRSLLDKGHMAGR